MRLVCVSYSLDKEVSQAAGHRTLLPALIKELSAQGCEAMVVAGGCRRPLRPLPCALPAAAPP